MGMCKPSGGIKTQVGRIGDLKAEGTPNSRTDLYNENLIHISHYHILIVFLFRLTI